MLLSQEFQRDSGSVKAHNMSKDKPKELHHGLSPERAAVYEQTNELVRMSDRLQLLREKMRNDLSPRDTDHCCGECDPIPHTTFERIEVNNHHIRCLTAFVDDLINRYEP